MKNVLNNTMNKCVAIVLTVVLAWAQPTLAASPAAKSKVTTVDKSAKATQATTKKPLKIETKKSEVKKAEVKRTETKKSVTKSPDKSNEQAAKSNSIKSSSTDDEQGGLYVYVDEEGTPHYALQALDSRYELFSNSGPEMSKDIKLAVGSPEKKIGRAYYGEMMSGLYVPSTYASIASPAVSKRLLNNPYLARYESTINRHASTYGVDVNLIKSVMAAESGFNASALSSKNAMGLMQVIPPTAARYGITAEQLMIPERNIYAGVRYLKDLSRMFKGRPELIVAAYNAGEGAVYKYKNQVPPYAETQNYVRKVMQYYSVYSQNSGAATIYVNTKDKKAGKTRTRKVVVASAPLNTGSNSRRNMQRLNVGTSATNKKALTSLSD